jgi:hypothetical protein
MGSTSKIIRRPVQVLLVVPRQRSLAFPSDQLSGMDVSQREQALSCLVNLLMLAAAGAAQEVNNDQC